MPDYVLEVEDLSVEYVTGRKPAVRKLFLKAKKGELIAIIGRAGSGKSTLLRTLNGIIPQYILASVDGKITYCGLNALEHETTKLAPHLGLVFEDPDTQIVSLTVAEDVRFGPVNLHLPREEVLKRMDVALDATRLKGFEERNPRTLSGGEKQSLAIAGVLALMPEILAMDEPVTMLDPLGKLRVLSIIRDLHKRRGLTTIITEAGGEIEAVAEVADRVVVMDNGTIMAEGTPREIFGNKEICEKIGLRPPQVTQLAHMMGETDPKLVPITLDEGVEFLAKILKGKKMRPLKGREVSPLRERNSVIEVRNLHHTYNLGTEHPVKALDGVSLDIYEGEKVAIIGQNGSGKTTLSYHLVGILKPTNRNAVVKVIGLDVTKADSLEIIKRINYVFQNPDMQFFSISVEEELGYGLKVRGLPEDEIKRRISELTEKMPAIKDYMDDQPKTLPRGIKTYVAAGSLLLLEPKILIVDEPTNGLDYSDIIPYLDFLRSLEQTVITITHNMEFVARFADRVIVMKEGKILLDGPTKEVFSKTEMLRETWIDPPQITKLGQRLSEFDLPPDILTVEEMYNCLKDVVRRGS